MNKFERNDHEKKQDFLIDQNWQSIKRHAARLSAINQKQATQQTSISGLEDFKSTTQSDITSLKSDVNSLKNSSSGQTGEEKVELCSYDCYKTKDRIYRDVCWLPRPIGFTAESGKTFKLRIKFDAVSSFETAITSTATITLDSEQILSDTKEIPAGGTHAVDFEFITTSERTGHRLEIELRNTETAQRRSNCCIPDLLTVELWGTNVQFVTRNCDFCVIPAGNNVVMTTMVYDNPQALFSIQPANSTLSLEESAFKFCKVSNYYGYNVVIPTIRHTYDTTENKIIYSDKASLLIHNFNIKLTTSRVTYNIDVDGNNETEIQPTGIAMSSCFIAKPIMSNSGNVYVYGTLTEQITIVQSGSIFYQKGGTAVPILSSESDKKENCDVCGVLRLDNNQDLQKYYGISTRYDGTSFFFAYKTPKEQKLELGFGTHSNAYLVEENNNIIVFLRVGKNTKKIVLEPDGDAGYYKIKSTSIIPNVQEYWLTPNGSHFERCGNKIKFYLANAKTPTQTIATF